MFKSRQLLFSTLIFALVPAFTLRGASGLVEYVGGTVKAIPTNATGAFSFDDSRNLLFSYGGSAVYSLPYEQITSTDVTKAESHHILRKIPVPSFAPEKRKETLTIAYKDAAGISGTLNFELRASQATEARDTIAAKKAFAAASAIPSNEWWGDRWWKTNRNQAAWETQTAQTAQPGQSATPATK
jgi:hypothetical protein